MKTSGCNTSAAATTHQANAELARSYYEVDKVQAAAEENMLKQKILATDIQKVIMLPKIT